LLSLTNTGIFCDFIALFNDRVTVQGGVLIKLWIAEPQQHFFQLGLGRISVRLPFKFGVLIDYIVKGPSFDLLNKAMIYTVLDHIGDDHNIGKHGGIARRS
jgi:hypothetical protein